MRRSTALLVIFLFASPSVALADRSLDVHGRIGASFGEYRNTFDFTLTENGESTRERVKRDDRVYGALGGLTASLDGFYGSSELEVQQISRSEGGERFKSTDLTFTFGKQFASGWGPFIGYRHVQQGRDAFDDEIQRENGFFAGLSYAGLSLGERIVTSFGAAYVRSDIRSGEIKFNDADGVSLRATAAFVGTPHSLSLRYRQFSSSIRLQDSGATLDTKVDESFLTLAYQYTLPITSLPMSSGF